jgi:hypothetical protein
VLAAVLLATTSVGVLAPLAAAGNPLTNPAHNVAEGSNFDYACSDLNATTASQTRCLNAALPRFDVARRLEGLPALVLPKVFVRLPIGQQLLILINLERTARGLDPAMGLSPDANRDAMVGARVSEDPPMTKTVFTSDLILGTNSALLAVFGWVYNDGWGGTRATTSNGDCLTAKTPACWGHRDSILTNGGGDDSAGGLVIGAATSRARGWLTVTVAMASATYKTLGGANLVVGYSSAGAKPIASVSVPGDNASALASDPGHVWVLNQQTATTPSSVVEISTSTGAVIRTVTDSSFAYPVAMADDGTDLWLANLTGGADENGSLTKIDVATGAVVGVINDPSLSSPVSVASGGTDVWVLNSTGGASGNGSVSEISVATGAVVAVLEDASINSPVSLTDTGAYIWVASSSGGANGAGSLTEFTVATGLVATVISEPAGGLSGSLASSGGLMVEVHYVSRAVPCGGLFTCVEHQVVTSAYSSQTGLPVSWAGAAGINAVYGGGSLWATNEDGTGSGLGTIIQLNPTNGRSVRTLTCPNAMEIPSDVTATAGQVWAMCTSSGTPLLSGPSWYSLKSKYKIR